MFNHSRTINPSWGAPVFMRSSSDISAVIRMQIFKPRNLGWGWLTVRDLPVSVLSTWLCKTVFFWNLPIRKKDLTQQCHQFYSFTKFSILSRVSPVISNVSQYHSRNVIQDFPEHLASLYFILRLPAQIPNDRKDIIKIHCSHFVLLLNLKSLCLGGDAKGGVADGGVC